MEDNIYGIIIVGLIFIAIGFIVTEKNAKYMLAGYNTMSENERANFDIKSYIKFFKKFHIFLGVSIAIGGAFSRYFCNGITEAIFMIAYPCLAYVFMVIYTQKFYKK